MYIDKLGNIIKYSNTYKTIKSKPVDVKPSIYILILIKGIMKKILNLKLVIILEHQNCKKKKIRKSLELKK